MAASPYLLRILSKPTNDDVDSWTKWYMSEGLPNLLSKLNATRATFYHVYNDFNLATKTPLDVNKSKLHSVQLTHTDLEPPADKTCLALCQLDSFDNLEEIFRLSDLTNDKAHGTVSDLRVYKLIQDFDPRGIGHTRPPFLLNVQNEPADAVDYNKFYSEEHLDMLNRVPGYRRSQRYQLIKGHNEQTSDAPKFMAVHEWESLDALDGPEIREADASPNTHRVFGNAKKVNIRGFKSLKAFGDLK
ncbi:hypothetical protein A1O7_09020 [Cladophialophora yegresii CBS 114405]|uniref:EthD domain-containing protein n=1 Tax=Cladophialophora yegresii CBS 114405 TaxID=1182544 RepID=W9WC35_9EURO|nr:uncharacterized protein A1O7_09020 [Cladophialophora yegresii CBS 114405]EXJ56089.1 hypothetical protein A1O7_09020 [Cladophialophora yegresii CBS 114405]